MNPMELLQLKQRMDRFFSGHPKVLPFFHAVNEAALEEGTVIEMKVTSPTGQALESNIRLNAEDVETIKMMMRLAGK